MNQVLKHGSYTRTNGAPETNIWPEFFLDTIEDPAASAREGRQCFKDEERVRMHFPGDQTKKPVWKVTQEHIDRWPKEYEAFRAGHEMSFDGVPLEQWAVLKKAQVLELKAAGFRTVQQVAAMTDVAAQRLGMGGSRLKQLAQAYLDDELSQAELARTTAENEKLRRDVVELSEKVANQAQLLESINAKFIALQNAPSPIATYIPGQNDPIAIAQQQTGAHQQFETQQAAHSALADLPAPRRRGKQGAEAGA